MPGASAKIFEDCARSLARTGTAPLEDLRGEEVLITGASGFIGCWVLSLIAFLNDAHGFDMRATAVARYPSRVDESAPFLTGRHDIGWTSADVRQLVTLPDRVSWVMHAAGSPDSRQHATNPIETAAVISEGTVRILRLAENATNLRGVLHVSSGLVEAASSRTGLASPTMAYVEAKRFSETLCYAFRTQAKLPVVITRPFTLLGPFQALDSPWAANNFLHAALDGQPLKIRGDGRAMRSYLYGSDMAAIALAQMVRGTSGETFDLGGSDPISIADLAALVVSRARRPLEIRINNTSRGQQDDHLLPDMELSATRTGITPAFSTLEAVTRTLAWYA